MDHDGIHVIHAVPSAGEHKGFIKPVVLRSAAFFYSKMPFPENSGLVLGSFHFMSNGPSPEGIRLRAYFVWVTPCMNSCFPVIITDRVGAQDGET